MQLSQALDFECLGSDVNSWPKQFSQVSAVDLNLPQSTMLMATALFSSCVQGSINNGEAGRWSIERGRQSYLFPLRQICHCVQQSQSGMWILLSRAPPNAEYCISSYFCTPHPFPFQGYVVNNITVLSHQPVHHMMKLPWILASSTRTKSAFLCTSIAKCYLFTDMETRHVCSMHFILEQLSHPI